MSNILHVLCNIYLYKSLLKDESISFQQIQVIIHPNTTTKLQKGQKNHLSDRVTAHHSCVNHKCIMGKAFRLKPDWVRKQKLHKQGNLGKRILSLVISTGTAC